MIMIKINIYTPAGKHSLPEAAMLPVSPAYGLW